MKIEAYVAAHCENNGKPIQKAACGVTLHFTDEAGRKSYREFAFPLGNSTKNQADLQSIRLAILSIRRKFQKEARILLRHNSYYVSTILGNREKKHKKNVGLIESVFNAIDACKSLQVVKSEDGLEKPTELAKVATESQNLIDSGTIFDGEREQPSGAASIVD